MNYKKMMGYSDTKKVTKKVSKPKVNEVLNSVKKEFGDLNESVTWNNRKFGDRLPTMEDYQEAHDKKHMKEGPAYEYKKDIKNIDKSYKLHAKSILNFYDKLRKKGLDKEASALIDTYKKNYVTFKKQYDKIVSKLL